MFTILNTDYFQLWFLYQSDLRISTAGKQRNYQNLTQKKREKIQFLPHYWWDKGFKFTVVNRAVPSLHVSSIEISLSVPFN